MSGDRYYITNQHQTYFITCTVTEWIDLFTRPVYKDIIVNSFNYCIDTKGLILNGWVLMSNHLHFAGRCEQPNRMSDFLRDFKKFTSKEFVKAILNTPESRREWLLDKFAFEARRSGRADNYKIWRDDNHAIDLQNIDIREKLNYMHNNPVRAGIVDKPENYVMSSARDYAGTTGLIRIDRV